MMKWMVSLLACFLLFGCAHDFDRSWIDGLNPFCSKKTDYLPAIDDQCVKDFHRCFYVAHWKNAMLEKTDQQIEDANAMFVKCLRTKGYEGYEKKIAKR